MRGQVKIYQRKIVDRRRRRTLFLSAYSLLFLGLVASGLSYLSHLDTFAIETVAVKGNSRLAASEVERVVKEKTTGNYFGLFSKQNSLLYPKDDVAAALLGLSLVKDVEVSRDGLRSLSIGISERGEEALWCMGGGTDDCYSIDENGLIFASKAVLSDSEFIYRGIIADEPLGKSFMPAADFKKIRFFMEQLSGLSIDPREALIDESGYMTVSLGDGGRIILDTKDDLSIVLGNIATIISDKSVAPSFSEFLSTLDYLKIDSGNKAVYKLKNSTVTAE